MSDRLSFEATRLGAKFIDAADDGHGATGQVKKKSFFGRSVKVQGQRFNAGSLVDFLNTQVSSDKQLAKGWFFGYGGSSNKEIKALFNELYPIDTVYRDKFNDIRSNFAGMKPIQDVLLTENVKDDPIVFSRFLRLIYTNKVMILTKGFDPDGPDAFKGIFISQIRQIDPPTLHICIPSTPSSNPFDIDAKDVLDLWLEEAIERLIELDIELPDSFCFDYNHATQQQMMVPWQMNTQKNLLLL